MAKTPSATLWHLPHNGEDLEWGRKGGQALWLANGLLVGIFSRITTDGQSGGKGTQRPSPAYGHLPHNGEGLEWGQKEEGPQRPPKTIEDPLPNPLP